MSWLRCRMTVCEARLSKSRGFLDRLKALGDYGCRLKAKQLWEGRPETGEGLSWQAREWGDADKAG